MKNMMICVIVLAAFLIPQAGYSYSVDLRYGWEPDEVEVSQRAGFDYVGVEGSVYLGSSLGRVYEVALLPPGSHVDDYRIVHEEWEELGGNFRLGVEKDGVVALMMGEEQGGIEYIGAGDLYGYRVLYSVVRPMRVVDGRVSVLKRLEVDVSCGTASGDLTVERRSAMLDDHMKQLVTTTVGGSVEGYGEWDVQGYKDWVSEGPSLDGSVVDCVIITVDSLAGEFERLADWHERLGVRTVVRTVEWIDSRYTGTDGPERVRNFLRHAYEQWGTIYVVLGGDPDVVPMRYAWTNHYGGAFIPTDAYYGNLVGNWNADGDAIFGEYGNETPEDPGDDVTFYAQLVTGRAPVKTSAEVATFIDKAMTYTTAPAPDFATTALFLGEVIFPMDWSPGEPMTLDGGVICDSAAAYFPSYYDTVKLYQRDGYRNMNRTTCLEALDVGYAFNVVAGHGDEFRTSAAEGDPPYLSGADFDTLSNGMDRAGFFYALNCNNSALDVDCVFRHAINNPSGGLMATYATTRYDFPNVGQYFLKEFLHYIFQRNMTRLGDVCSLHHNKFIPSGMVHDGAVRWSLLTYILVGDPVIHLWTDVPDTLEVTAGADMALSDSVFSVEVHDDGMALEGATVVLVGDRGEYGIGVTGGDGVAAVTYRPRGLGYVDLVVNKGGFLVYEDSVEVVGGGGRLYVSSSSVDDGAGWVGNDDGEAGWGERVGLDVGVTNGGMGTLGGVSGQLRVVPGCSLWVSVALDDSIRSDSIVYVGSGGLHPSTMPFGLDLTEDVLGRGPSTHGEDLGCWIWLDGMGWHLRWISDGDPHTYACSLSVFGEMLGYSGHWLEAADSLVLAGSLLTLEGTLDVGDFGDGIDIVLGNDGAVTVHDAVEDYGSVGSSEVTRSFDVEFGGVGPGDEIGVWFEAELSEGGGGSWRDWFRVLVHEGELAGERIEFVPLSGDTVEVTYGIRNHGSGGLVGVEGRLRALAGAEVYDSVSTYGNLTGGSYAEGDGYTAREIGSPVRYEIELTDGYGRHWVDTVDVRTVEAVSGLSYAAGDDNLGLSWAVSDDSLFVGYDVYRSDTYGGPYSLVGVVDGMGWLRDESLASEEDYYYFVRVRDDMGNTSAPSETLEAWTGSPYQAGWPVAVSASFPSSPVLADLDGDDSLEIIIGAKDEKVRVWHHDGTLAAGWPNATGNEVWSSAAVANLDGDPDLEIVIGSSDGNIYAWNLDGVGVRFPDGYFRAMGGNVRCPPAIDDIDNDLDLEIFACNSYGQVYAWHHDGTGLLQGNGLFAQAAGDMSGSPAIADLDKDGDVEIIVSSANGKIYVWNHDGTGYLDSTGIFASPGGMYGSPAVGDIDGNGDMEIVIAGHFWLGVAAYDHNGSFHSGWPRNIDHGAYASPALADLDDDGRLDIIVGTHGGEYDDSASVYVFSDNGNARPGWPKKYGAFFFSSPVVGDIDGDGEADIVIPATDGRIYAWHENGEFVKGWPRDIKYPLYASPSLADLDGDGDVEIVAAGYDGKIHIFDASAPYDAGTMMWPKLCHDLYNSGLYDGPSKAGTPTDRKGLPKELVLLGYPSPAYETVNIRLGIPSTSEAVDISVDVFDVLGRHIKRVHRGALEPGYHELTWDGTDEHSRRVASGIYFVKASRRGNTKSRKIVLVR